LTWASASVDSGHTPFALETASKEIIDTLAAIASAANATN
jgi:hypothetical protein